ncbi:winged helix-turn-helix domain-containing protein [Patescibacteria group bacterium]
MNKKDYPITQESMRKYARDFFSPIAKGECVTSIWVPVAGRRTHTEFIIDNVYDYEEFLPNAKRYIFVYIDPLNLTNETSLGYLKLMYETVITACDLHKMCHQVASKYKKIYEDNKLEYSALLRELKNFLKELFDHKHHTVFVLAEIDDFDWLNTYFFGNLKAIWNEAYPAVQYVFLLKEDVKKRKKVYLWRDLNQLILQNVTYFPLFSKNDSKHIVNRIAKQLELKITGSEMKEMLQLCGGHPYMIYVAMKELDHKRVNKMKKSEFLGYLSNHHTMDSIIHAVFDVFDEVEMSILKKVALRRKLTTNELRTASTLRKLKLIFDHSGSKRKIYNSVLREGVLHISSGESERESNISVDPETSQVMLNGASVEDKFSQQEHEVLVFLINNSEIVVGRDDLAKIMWGDEAGEKYSDWAIDQLMSKLRKKLKNLGANGEVKTIRGKGYKYSTEDG